MPNSIKTTKTRTGPKVRSIRVEKEHRAGTKVSKQQVAGLNPTRNTTLPQWNYDIKPHGISVPTET